MDQIDMNDMQSMVKAFPKMLVSVQISKETQDMCIKLREDDLGGICIIGMGGSSIAGQYVQALLQDSVTTPIINVHDSIIPSYVDKSWVIIAVSYSGNTEETLASHEEAKKRGCHPFAIASGGKLLSGVKGKNSIILPANYQPRAAFPLMFSTILHVVECLTGRELTDLKVISETLRKKQTQWEESPMAPNTMAEDLQYIIPVFIGSRHLIPVAYRAKCQINENAKTVAFSSEIPEANHNEIESFVGENEHEILPVFLRSNFEDDRMKQRFDITAQIYEDEGFAPLKLGIKSNSRIEEMLMMTYYLDMVSVELAELRGVNPISVDRIMKLKSSLK
ncbi:MAG: bifunctional phosphoglucose/phosphomannose isomerase [Candidatus Thorarchaeota archaeon]